MKSALPDHRIALRLVWLTLSVAGACLVLLPIVFGDRVAGIIPECPSKLAGSSCIACGLTTAFIQIAAGDFNAARNSHRGSVVLYSVLAGNTLIAAAYTAAKMRKEKATCKS